MSFHRPPSGTAPFRPSGCEVNPDCGLNTRGWSETRASLENLVAAAQEVRDELPAS
ncbi:hypothetical protein OTB20_22615 [Streptomyces sp. H27-H1]|nr:hypothetical protein [Streptomyces sp. H27-H1]MCY0928955.1 hypothetical protein [Streptomyces sp. H27-H1]